MSHESCDAEYESHRIRVEGRTNYKKGPWPLRSCQQGLGTRRLLLSPEDRAHPLADPQRKVPPTLPPISLDGQLFHPAGVVRWLGYWLSPAITISDHFNYRLALAKAAFAFIKRLSSPGWGTRLYLAHRVAMGLFLPILNYGADLLVPNHRTT